MSTKKMTSTVIQNEFCAKKIGLKSPALPPNFNEHIERIKALSEHIEGFTNRKELSFLALLAAMPTCEGEVLEIGAACGQSTIVLAQTLSFAGLNSLYSVDPLTLPSITDPEFSDKNHVRTSFYDNLKNFKSTALVNFFEMTSGELSKQWDKPLRLLWIDGDHTYYGVKQDVENFSRFLRPGAIIAMHDVLYKLDGPPRVFLEYILSSEHYGACGIYRSVGWAQYIGTHTQKNSKAYEDNKTSLRKKLMRLIPYLPYDKKNVVKKYSFKLLRELIPNGAISSQQWINKIDWSFIQSMEGQ